MEVEDDRLARVLGELCRTVEARSLEGRESARQAEFRCTISKKSITKG